MCRNLKWISINVLFCLNNSSGQITSTSTTTTPPPHASAPLIGKFYHRYQHQHDHELASHPIPELPMWFDKTIVESGDYSLNPEIQDVHRRDTYATTTSLLLRAQALLTDEVKSDKKVKRKSGRHSSASSCKSYSSQSSLDDLAKLDERDVRRTSHREWRKTRTQDDSSKNGVKFKGS